MNKGKYIASLYYTVPNERGWEGGSVFLTGSCTKIWVVLIDLGSSKIVELPKFQNLYLKMLIFTAQVDEISRFIQNICYFQSNFDVK